MRDSGRDRDPAGCEISRGCPAGKRAHLGSPSAEKLLTEEPSCKAEDMTAPTTHATPKKALDQRAPSRHDIAVATPRYAISRPTRSRKPGSDGELIGRSRPTDRMGGVGLLSVVNLSAATSLM